MKFFNIEIFQKYIKNTTWVLAYFANFWDPKALFLLGKECW